MKLKFLSENRLCDGINCINEEALSIYIEVNEHKILLDSGKSDAFIKNAETMGVNLDKVEKFVLSHGHYDHGDGFKYLDLKEKRPLILHPECYTKRFSLKRNMAYSGINQTREELMKKFDLIETREPYELYENVWFLGEINRKYLVPAKNMPSVFEDQNIDYMIDDSGMVIKTEEGIVVIGCCSHSGIDNIIEQAKKVAQDDRIIAVIGGFHLKKIDEYTQSIVEYFKNNNVKNAYMGHCTSDEVIDYFEKELKGVVKVTKLYSGLEIKI